MSLVIINKQDMASFVSSTMEEYAVIGPVARRSEFIFAPLTDASELRLDYDTSILPPKKARLPQEETLFTFQTDGNFSTKPVLDDQRRIIFLRVCNSPPRAVQRAHRHSPRINASPRKTIASPRATHLLTALRMRCGFFYRYRVAPK